MPVIKAVLFDLDGTLLDRDETFRRFLESQARRHPDLVPARQIPSYVAGAMEIDGDGYEPMDVVFSRIAESLLGDPSKASCLFDEFRARFPEECVPTEGAEDAVQALEQLGLKTGLITNGSEGIQQRKVQKLSFIARFDAVLISEFEGLRKPDPAIFERALERLEVQAGEAVYVGDNPEADVRGAKGAGLWSVWMRTGHWPEPEEADAAIDALPELVTVVQGLAQGDAQP
ncbi:MAG: HAD family hydrolase [Longimicrobiales bacterium]